MQNLLKKHGSFMWEWTRWNIVEGLGFDPVKDHHETQLVEHAVMATLAALASPECRGTETILEIVACQRSGQPMQENPLPPSEVVESPATPSVALRRVPDTLIAEQRRRKKIIAAIVAFAKTIVSAQRGDWLLSQW